MEASPLILVPAEVRTNIYQHVFERSRIRWPYTYFRAANRWKLAILFTCRAINHEATPVLASSMKLNLESANLDTVPKYSAQRYLPHLRFLQIDAGLLGFGSSDNKLEELNVARIPSLQTIHLKMHDWGFGRVLRAALPSSGLFPHTLGLADRCTNDQYLIGQFDDLIKSGVRSSANCIALVRWVNTMQLKERRIACKTTSWIPSTPPIMYSHPVFLEGKGPMLNIFDITVDSAELDILERNIILMCGDGPEMELMVKTQNGTTNAFRKPLIQEGDSWEHFEARNWSEAFNTYFNVVRTIEGEAEPNTESTADRSIGKASQSIHGEDSRDEDDIDNDGELEGDPNRLQRQSTRFREWRSGSTRESFVRRVMITRAWNGLLN